MANQLILDRALDANGYVAAGAKATVYAAGTTTLISVYSDADGSTVAANPIVADGNGFWPQRFVSLSAKIVVTDADDVALYTLDPAPVSQGTGAAGASAIPFDPSVDVPESNVQDAIDHVAASVISGFAEYGIGITGNAELLANIDATGTGAGIYRFDGTSTGTFPTGVAAADTGLIELWRQAGATAMMELHHATSNRVFRRRMTASAWGAWREIITGAQGATEGDMLYRGASDWTRLAKGTAGQLLRINSGATAPEWHTPTGMVWLSEIATTSGSTPADFDIPSAAKEIEIAFLGVTTASDTDLLVRLGTASAFEATGYTQRSVVPTLVANTVSTAFGIAVGSGDGPHLGAMQLRHLGANKWSQSHSLAVNNTTRGAVGGGFKTLADVLTRVRVLPASGNWSGGAVVAGYRIF